MEKAHELHNIKTSEKKPNPTPPLSIGNRAHRLIEQQMDMPAIEELADKENDTFAQGGPLAGLARQISKEKVQRDRSNVRSASQSSKPGLLGSRTDEPKDKYKMYREPGDESSMGIGLLAAKERQQKFVSGSRLSHQPTTHDSSTPTSNLRKAADLVASMNAREGTGVITGPTSLSGVRLPRIPSSSRQSHLGTPSYSQQHNLSRAHSRQNIQGPSLHRIYSSNSKLSSAGKRNYQYITNNRETNVQLEPSSMQLSPSSERKYQLQRPRSI